MSVSIHTHTHTIGDAPWYCQMVILDSLKEIKGGSKYRAYPQLRLDSSLRVQPCVDFILWSVAIAVYPALSLGSFGLMPNDFNSGAVGTALSHSPFYFELELHFLSSGLSFNYTHTKKVFWHCMIKTERMNGMRNHTLSSCSWVDTKRMNGIIRRVGYL